MLTIKQSLPKQTAIAEVLADIEVKKAGTLKQAIKQEPLTRRTWLA